MFHSRLNMFDEGQMFPYLLGDGIGFLKVCKAPVVFIEAVSVKLTILPAHES